MKIWMILLFPLMTSAVEEVNEDPCGDDTPSATATAFCTQPLGSQCVSETNGTQWLSVCMRVDNLPTVPMQDLFVRSIVIVKVAIVTKSNHLLEESSTNAGILLLGKIFIFLIFPVARVPLKVVLKILIVARNNVLKLMEFPLVRFILENVLRLIVV